MTSMPTNILSAVLVLITIIYAYYKFVVYTYWKKRNVPYLEPSFPFGNISFPLRRKHHFGIELANHYRAAKEKGWKYFGIFSLGDPFFVPVDLDILKLIMTKDFSHFVDRGFYYNEKDEPIGAHLFSIGGTKWRNLRTTLTPTFTSGKMRMMFQTLADCGTALEKFIGDVSGRNEPVDIKDILGCFSTDIIGSCAFGLNCNALLEPDNEFRVNSKRIFEVNVALILKITIANAFPSLAKWLGVTTVPEGVEKFFTDVVQKTVDYRERNNIERKDFLQLLIDIKNNKEEEATRDGKTLTMDEIVAQSFVFFIAGFETSSTTMSFVLYELARNSDVQDKVRQELHRVLRKHNNQITYDSLSELEYMQQVIDEALRRYPPVSFITRKCTQDYNIPGTDSIIEKGIRVIIPVAGIHYDEEYYVNPTEFDPDRFDSDHRKDRNQYAHIPFGEGPRLCIGMRFGLMQTKVGLASILNNYRVTLNSKTEVPLKLSPNTFILTAEDGVWLDIEKLKP